ncbi:unnamed protein product [Lasius platythorax]|uniref:Uncharacterized protein n=1 Tax=Lasius platythorax TaxID=488582 RepID=A0AAV2N681_9HYME
MAIRRYAMRQPQRDR